MLGRNNELLSTGTSAEDQMKIHVVRQESQEVYEKNLYKEAARRVVFGNCMTACELDDKKVPNFNRDFYYGQPGAQACLQECYNARMNLHFGPTVAKKEALQIDFKQLKEEYHRYENWNPHMRIMKEMSLSNSSTTVQSITQQLLDKSRKERSGKFDFQ